MVITKAPVRRRPGLKGTNARDPLKVRPHGLGTGEPCDGRDCPAPDIVLHAVNTTAIA
jgi:hypothetical protein